MFTFTLVVKFVPPSGTEECMRCIFTGFIHSFSVDVLSLTLLWVNDTDQVVVNIVGVYKKKCRHDCSCEYLWTSYILQVA